jgi:hypothetical protein
MRAYDAFYKRLIAQVPLKNVSSRFRHGAGEAEHRPAARGKRRARRKNLLPRPPRRRTALSRRAKKTKVISLL